MITAHTVESLRAFEDDIASEFNAGRIRAPVHLSWNNEQQLLDIFRDVGPQDWVCTTWRSHYHCLLKGVPPAEVKTAIMAGRSITLTFPEHRVIASAIVGGITPIALGLAWAIKRQGGTEKVWCFVGDMTSRTGAFVEAMLYAGGHSLPLHMVVENNGRSVLTDTQEVWGDYNNTRLTTISDTQEVWGDYNNTRLTTISAYTYDLASKWPHAGAGQRVQF